MTKEASRSRFNSLGSFRSVLVAAVGELFEVMNQAVEQPLDADLGQAAAGEAVEPFGAAQVGKDGFR